LSATSPSGQNRLFDAEPFRRAHLGVARSFEVLVMSPVVKRSAAGPIKTSAPRARQDAPLPRWIPPQLCQLVETAPSGPQWLHEIKLDGFRMSARIERGQVRLLTRTGLDWSDKYPNVIAALAKVRARTAYLDGELCGVGDDGLPSFSQTQAASDGSHGVRLVYYVFDLLHLDGRDTASLPLIERKALLKSLVAGIPGLQFNDHETGDGELIRRHACGLGFEGVVSKTIDAPYAPRNRGLWRKSKCLNRQEFVSSAGPTRKDRARISARSCSATIPTTASSSMPAA
jgi:ATP-dependent DNA ligase